MKCSINFFLGRFALSMHLEQHDLQVELRRIADFEGDQISQMTLLSSCDVVVLPVESRSIKAQARIQMLNDADCADLRVR
jgi:hypothetical protein